MSPKFNQFKTKMTIEVLVRALLISLSVGLLLAGGAFIAIKVTGFDTSKYFSAGETDLTALVIAGAGVLVAAALFCLIFFPFRPSDKKVAKRLDEELGLNEKVQTMVAYRDQTSAIHEIQREDTINILSAKPTKALKFKTPILLICAFALTAAVFTTSQVLPKKEIEISHQQKPEDPPYVVSTWQQEALVELIKYVKESEATNDAKKYLVHNLESLLNYISNEDGHTQTEMFQQIDIICAMNDADMNKVNISDDIGDALFHSASTGVRQIGQALKQGKPEIVEKAILDLREDLNRETWKAYGQEVHEELGLAMKEALGNIHVYETDEEGNPTGVEIDLMTLPMPKQLWRMSISILSETEACKSQAEFYEALKSPCEQCAAKLPDLIVEEAMNVLVKDYVNKRLIEIFKVTPEDHKIVTSTSNNTNWEDNGQDNNPGGYGKGDFVVGSDDTILDADEGYVPYAEVIGKYLAELIEMYEDGVLPEEYKDLIDYYYGLLYGTEKGDTEEIVQGDGEGTGE